MEETQNQETMEEMTTVNIDDQESSNPVVTEENEKEETRTTVQEDSNQELENYSENVQKRINELTAKRKTAIEEAEAAVNFAKQKDEENKKLKKQLEDLNTGYVGEYGTRIESQSAEAKRLAKEAYDQGDMDKFTEAQELIAKLAIEKERLRIQKAKVDEQQNVSVETTEQTQNAAPTKAPPLDPKLVDWMDRNKWFNKDTIMTSVAQAIHYDLVNEKYDTTSDEYYEEIDRRMRKELPNKFQEKRNVAQSVAPASNGRSVKSGRKKSVELTPGEVAFANKMKIPLERFAKEKAKIEQRNV